LVISCAERRSYEQRPSKPSNRIADAAEAKRAEELAGPEAPRVRDRSRSVAKRLRKLNRTLAARTGRAIRPPWR